MHFVVVGTHWFVKISRHLYCYRYLCYLLYLLLLLFLLLASLLQYIHLLYGKLRERAVCSEFCVLIGYPSGEDGAILPARDCPFRSRK